VWSLFAKGPDYPGCVTDLGDRDILLLVIEDANAFMELYVREREVVTVFIARRTFDVSVAADLTAETFALALTSWSRLRGRSQEEQRAWLFTVARRQVSRYFRRSRIELRATQRLGIHVPEVDADDAAAIEERAGLAELRASVRAELERLSAEQREALRLRVVEEHSYEEVALALGISEQAARARVSRGLRALARSLEPQRAIWEASA
jgi:RNA polymerase sigma factor (sigma-70 family)